VSSTLQVSQGYEILAPRSGKAYPVPCEEWKFLKGKLVAVSSPPWVLPALSFVLLGAALATLIAILIGGVSAGPTGHGIIVAWAATLTTGICGAVCLAVAQKQQSVERSQVSEVVRQMELIENRFDAKGA